MEKIKQYEKFKQYFLFVVLATALFETQNPRSFLILMVFVIIDFIITSYNAFYLLKNGIVKSSSGIFVWMGLFLLVIIYIIIRKKSLWMPLFF